MLRICCAYKLTFDKLTFDKLTFDTDLMVMQTDADSAQLPAAALASLRLAFAAAWLGPQDCRPSASLLRELLADAAAHAAAAVQSAAALLAPAYLAAAAGMSAAGLSQVLRTCLTATGHTDI